MEPWQINPTYQGGTAGPEIAPGPPSEAEVRHAYQRLCEAETRLAASPEVEHLQGEYTHARAAHGDLLERYLDAAASRSDDAARQAASQPVIDEVASLVPDSDRIRLAQGVQEQAGKYGHMAEQIRANPGYEGVIRPTRYLDSDTSDMRIEWDPSDSVIGLTCHAPASLHPELRRTSAVPRYLAQTLTGHPAAGGAILQADTTTLTGTESNVGSVATYESLFEILVETSAIFNSEVVSVQPDEGQSVMWVGAQEAVIAAQMIAEAAAPAEQKYKTKKRTMTRHYCRTLMPVSDESWNERGTFVRDFQGALIRGGVRGVAAEASKQALTGDGTGENPTGLLSQLAANANNVVTVTKDTFTIDDIYKPMRKEIPHTYRSLGYNILLNDGLYVDLETERDSSWYIQRGQGYENMRPITTPMRPADPAVGGIGASCQSGWISSTMAWATPDLSDDKSGNKNVAIIGMTKNIVVWCGAIMVGQSAEAKWTEFSHCLRFSLMFDLALGLNDATARKMDPLKLVKSSA